MPYKRTPYRELSSTEGKGALSKPSSPRLTRPTPTALIARSAPHQSSPLPRTRLVLIFSCSTVHLMPDRFEPKIPPLPHPLAVLPDPGSQVISLLLRLPPSKFPYRIVLRPLWLPARPEFAAVGLSMAVLVALAAKAP